MLPEASWQVRVLVRTRVILLLSTTTAAASEASAYASRGTVDRLLRVYGWGPKASQMTCDAHALRSMAFIEPEP